MSFTDWLEESKEEIDRLGLYRGGKAAAHAFLAGGLARMDHLGPQGENFYSKDWDVILVLDACRYDLMEEVLQNEEFDYAKSLDHIYSTGGYSRSWMENTFTSDYEDQMKNTAYVTGNPFTEKVYPDGNHPFAVMDEVWKYGWNYDIGTIPPRYLNDRAINHWRNREETDVEQMIIHYMQPHIPFIGDPNLHPGFTMDGEWADREDQPKDMWIAYRDGELDIDFDSLMDEYRTNLVYVMNELRVLLRNLDAESVYVSSDHGNALGEYGLWGHRDWPIDAVKKVPWLEVESKDTHSYEPWINPENPPEDTEGEDSSVEDRLEALGYK